MEDTNFQVEFIHDDPDVIAKSRMNFDGKQYDITIVTGASGSVNNKYLPEVISIDETNVMVVFDAEHMEHQINSAVEQAQEELEEIGNTTDYPNHIGSAAASVISMYLNRALLSVKKHLKVDKSRHAEGFNLFWNDEDEG